MLKNVRDADLHLLRVFVAVAECAGIAAAQERLNVAASTISTQISNLETRLGVRLCERGRGGFSLTAEGKLVLEAAYKLLKDVGLFLHSVEAVKGKLLGTVNMVVLDNIIQNPQLRLSQALRVLRAEHPLLEVEMHQLPPGQLENAIVKHEADIGISWIASRLPSLSRQSIFVEHQVICCGWNHPLYERAPHNVTDGELEAADWVRRGYRMPRSLRFASPPTSSAIAYHMEGVAHFILAGTHIGYLPRHYVEHWLQSGEMRLLCPRRHSYELNFQVLSRTDMNMNPMVRTVRETLIDVHI